MNILETPYTETLVTTYNYFIIKDIKVELNTRAIINILLKSDDTNKPPIVKVFILENQDYNLWAADDNYIIGFIKNKLLE